MVERFQKHDTLILSSYIQYPDASETYLEGIKGHFLTGGEQLQLTLEAVDVEANRLVWQDTLRQKNEVQPGFCSQRRIRS